MKNLICAVCGGEAPGRQWWNRDQGYGICARCFEDVAKKEGRLRAIHSYGRPGVHHSPKPKERGH